MNKEDLIRKIRESDSSKIKNAIADIDGVLRGKYIHIKCFSILSIINWESVTLFLVGILVMFVTIMLQLQAGIGLKRYFEII